MSVPAAAVELIERLPAGRHDEGFRLSAYDNDLLCNMEYPTKSVGSSKW